LPAPAVYYIVVLARRIADLRTPGTDATHGGVEMREKGIGVEAEGVTATLGRRELLTQAFPACAMACFGVAGFAGPLAAAPPCIGQDPHKFDVKRARELSSRDLTRLQNQAFIRFIGTLRKELGDEATVRLLNEYSAAYGRQVGEQQAGASPDRTFKTFTAVFRPPNYADTLTLEIVEDTENAFGLRVTECVWASVFREAGLGGDIGHAAVCNMDYYWPQAFNPAFHMERTKTLMRGDEYCNHRYLQKAERP
jgi:predicted ArsR family transcriptional regulator